MNQNELKRLGRKELLELLLEATQRSEELEKELEETKAALSDRNIRIAKAGSIAEASLQLNDIFAVAQKAADDYLNSVKSQTSDVDALIEKAEAASKKKIMEQEAASEQKIMEQEAASEKKIKEQEAASEKKIKEQEALSVKKCRAMIAKAKKESKAYWSELEEKLNSFYDTHKGLREMIQDRKDS